MSYRISRNTLNKLMAKASSVTSANSGNKKYKKYGIVVFNMDGFGGQPFMVTGYSRHPRSVSLVDAYGKPSSLDAPQFTGNNVRYASKNEVKAFFAIADKLPLHWASSTKSFIKGFKRG